MLLVRSSCFCCVAREKTAGLMLNTSFALFAGDAVNAVVWDTLKEHNIAPITTIHDVMGAYLLHVYPVVGNHEMRPANLVPPFNSKFASASWMDDAVVTSTAHWLGADTGASMRRTGSSSVLHCAGNLRILTLNAEIDYKLITTSTGGRCTGTRTSRSPSSQPSSRAPRLAARYAGFIRAIVFGHTHADELTAGLWTEVTQAFGRDDHLFKEYPARKTRSVRVKPCTGRGKSLELCQLRAARAKSNCFRTIPGLKLGKTDLGEGNEEIVEGGGDVLSRMMHGAALELLANSITEGGAESKAEAKAKEEV
ncbi:hypothetical protein BN1708_006542 [Verticillium longisporum]|uniref:Calcineurin-like phosphoesterase domain-containing protein n=1 Tax=Verticillium longisporum TaxID=100787 RepID=A0A0G4MKY7_VERLO|nr:hypothetical protein BN1708_006542 [Verticillium longisporum]